MARIKSEVILPNPIEDVRRRIDFTVEAPTLVVGVENKPWADDQQDQLNDYVDRLSERYGNRFFIVYISGDGSQPTSLSNKRRESLGTRFKLLSYPIELRAWLESCETHCV